MTIQWSLGQINRTPAYDGSLMQKKQSKLTQVYDDRPIVYQPRAQEVAMKRIVIIGSSGSGNLLWPDSWVAR